MYIGVMQNVISADRSVMICTDYLTATAQDWVSLVITPVKVQAELSVFKAQDLLLSCVPSPQVALQSDHAP